MHGVTVGVGLGGGVPVAVAVAVAVGVAVDVGVAVAVAVGVGLGDPPPGPEVPKSWNISSGSPELPVQVVLLPQVLQPVPKPPPGFCQAALTPDATARSLQLHWPPTDKSKFACTETQYLPVERTTLLGNVIVKTSEALVYAQFSRVATVGPGKVETPA